MPMSSPHICNHIGCKELTRTTYCITHTADKAIQRKTAYGRYNTNRQTTTAQGYGSDWNKLSLWYRSMHPLCEQCLASGITTPVALVHHKAAVKENKSLRLDIGNLISLCKKHHREAHQ